MSGMGVTGRAALALAATAVLSAGLTALLVARGLDNRVRDATEQRLHRTATHAALLAASGYAAPRGWTREMAAVVAHAASISGYRGILLDARGRVVTTGEATLRGPTAAIASAPVRVGGRRVGTVLLEAPRAQLQAEERDLTRRVTALALLAGTLAVAAALLAVPFLAATVVRPLRRLHEAIGRLREGVRVPEDGPREIADVARRFNALSEGLEQEEAARRSMAADVAHELRTPLSGLLLRIEAAQDGVLADPRRNLEAMSQEARRLGSLIEDVEALAESERPGLLLERTRVDLSDLARDRVAAHAAAFATEGVELREHLGAAAAVDGDAGRLGQVLDNLLTNALRYTDRGGAVTVAVAATDGSVTLDVTDTGIGIAPADLPHVFDRFWRADRSRSRATGGSGVGLAVVERLVAAHDGRVTLESEVGRGTSVHVRLPASRAGEPAP